MKQMVLLFVALNVTTVVFAQGFKAALFTDNQGAIQVVAKHDGQHFDLVFRSEQMDKVRVNILDTRQRVVFTETFRNRDAFVRPYNLENLPAGEYTFEVTARDGNRYTQQVTVQ